MKLTHLFTLSQFVDKVKNMPMSEVGLTEHKLRLIYLYNEFLKQRLDSKSVLIIVRGWHESGITNVGNIHYWTNIHQESNLCHSLIASQEPDYRVSYRTILLDFKPPTRDAVYTFSDLADLTNGKLELKDVEI